MLDDMTSAVLDYTLHTALDCTLAAVVDCTFHYAETSSVTCGRNPPCPMEQY